MMEAPMTKTRKPTAAPDPPRIGDKVKPGKSEMVYTVSSVSDNGKEVNLYVPETNLERFRVQTDTLTFVERSAPVKTSNPFTTAEPAFNIPEVLEKIESVRAENLQRSDDDVDILKAYLKTQGAPKAAIAVLETLTVEQHKNWKKAVEKIEELLEK
jgi:hypothetical protein